MGIIALECVGYRVPDNYEQDAWGIQQRLLRHLFRCWGFVINGSLDGNDINLVLNNFGNLRFDKGRLDEAQKMYQ
jgi:hypothetical protein